jgi:LacI family transcriptional regulator
MPKFLQKIPRVLAVLPTVQKACRDKLQGILKYARIHGPWDVQTQEDHPWIARLGDFKTWKPDGIILGAPVARLTATNRSSRVPTVALDMPGNGSRNASTVCHDSRLIAETSAQHLIRLGFECFGFVGCVPLSAFSLTRAESFVKRVRAEGFPCHVYGPADADDWGLEQRHMREWLRALPKPCGIMVAIDLRAKQVLDTCLAAGIRIPEEVAVVGVDNDETLCENTTPTLSSVLPDFEGGGYLAAELLDRLMRGTQKKPAHLTYGVRRLVQRQSTLYVPKSDRLIGQAVEFVRLNACAGITVMDVVEKMNVSRRYAERHFRATCGHSILGEIQLHRLERVCTLLRETNLPICAIGERCGYDSEIYLKVLFKKRFGMTMRAYRKADDVIRPLTFSLAASPDPG